MNDGLFRNHIRQAACSGLEYAWPLDLFHFKSEHSRHIALRKNRFSSPAFEWNALTEPKQLQQIKWIAKKLGVTNVREISSSGEPAVAADNYRLTLRNEQSFVLKRCKAGEKPEQLAALKDILEYLKRRGINAPSIKRIKTVNREQWLVYDYVPAISHFSGQGLELYNFARMLGQCHAALKHYEHRFIARDDNNFMPQGYEATTLYHPAALYQQWNGLRRILDRAPSVPGILDCRVRDIEIGLRYFSNNYPELCQTGSRVQLIHNDIHPHNILKCADGKLSLIDFHFLSRRSLHTDIGWAFYQTVKQAASNAAGSFGLLSTETAEKLGRFFRLGYRTGNPSYEWDDQVVFGYALQESLALLFHHLKGIYVDGQKRWLFDLSRHFDDVTDLLNLLPITLKLAR